LNDSPVTVFVEHALLAITLSLIILRTTYIENPHVEQLQTRFFLTSEIVSLYLSTALLACFGLWLLVRVLTGRLRWRKTFLGAGAGLFLLAGIVACLAASNKRAAVTDLVVLITPMLTAMFLIQLLGSRQKVHLAILLVMAAAVAMTAQCMDQLVDSNADLIRNYEQDPAAQLKQLNIEPDSLDHWLYEHRLYSRDIRGFLMTSNSAASFFLLAFFAGLGLCLDAFRQRQRPECLVALVGYGLAFLFGLGGLLLTQSKGGLGALGIGAVLLAVLSVFGRRLWKHRLAVGIVLLTGVGLAATAIIAYGTRHGRLPGGNSLLVRWQYWQSTARMIGDHALTGVGGGNFRFLYPFYKVPAATETIQDPHNFILSLLGQYGPLGLLAFLAAVLYPIYKGLAGKYDPADLTAFSSPPMSKKLWMALTAVSVCMLLFVRPMLVDATFLHQSADVRSAAYVVLYLFPAGVFVLAFGLLGAVAAGDGSMRQRSGFLMPALICGMTAVLIHNLVDFAIFEPGVWNLFWLTAALLVSCRHNDAALETPPVTFSGVQRVAAGLSVCGILIAYLAIAVLPPVRANRLFRRALMSPSPQWEVLDQAIAADRLSPDTAYNAAGLLMQAYARQRPSVKDVTLLQRGEKFADIARQRNPESFKPYRLAADLALMQADRAEAETRTAFIQAAYDLLGEALDRYPGSDRIHYRLAQLAEQLGRTGEALTHYEQAVAIERAYQTQFKIMYPNRSPVISRLGNTAYTIAQAKIEELGSQLDAEQDR
jgi:hypothetical protein